MEAALKEFDIYVYSSRSCEPSGRMAMFNYVGNHGSLTLATALRFVSEKPSAFITIDDRCLRFDGDWSDPNLSPEVLLRFTPWYKYQK